MKLLKRTTKIDMFMASAVSRDSVEEAQTEIEALLRQRHRIQPGQDSDFMIRSQQEIAQTADQTSRQMSAPARGDRLDLASRRRHRDHEHHAGLGDRADARDRDPHGDRREGARHPDAVPDRSARPLDRGRGDRHRLGIGTSRFLAWKQKWPIVLSPTAVLLAFGFSAAIGIFFGFYPGPEGLAPGSHRGPALRVAEPPVTPAGGVTILVSRSCKLSATADVPPHERFPRLRRAVDPRRSFGARLLFGFSLAFLVPGALFVILLSSKLTDLQQQSAQRRAAGPAEPGAGAGPAGRGAGYRPEVLFGVAEVSRPDFPLPARGDARGRLLITRRFTAPIADLVRAAEEIGQGRPVRSRGRRERTSSAGSPRAQPDGPPRRAARRDAAAAARGSCGRNTGPRRCRRSWRARARPSRRSRAPSASGSSCTIPT